MFSSLYELMLRWAGHRLADRYLAIIAFAESSFFPIPVEVMIAPMTFATPHRAWRIATIATVFSVIGGMFGYAIGYYAFDIIEPIIVKFGYASKFDTVTHWFQQWGFWVVFLAGFSPLPYKLFTIAAGVLSLSLLPFALASIIGRGARFFLVTYVFAKMGPKLAPVISQYIEWIGWTVVCLFLLLVYWLAVR